MGNDAHKKAFFSSSLCKRQNQLILRGMQVCFPFQSSDVYYLTLGMKDTWVKEKAVFKKENYQNKGGTRRTKIKVDSEEFGITSP